MSKIVLAAKEYTLENEIYTPIVKETPFEKMGGTYYMEMLEGGEEVLLPNIKMPTPIDMKNLNRFGKARLKYLKEERETQYQMMYLEGTLMEHLLSIQKQVETFWEREEMKMIESFGMTTQQDQDFLKYAGLKKNLYMTLTKMAMEQIVWV